MESDFTPEDALLEIDRAAVAPWIDYPATPWWYYPTVGAWLGALQITLFGLDLVWGVVGTAVLLALEFLFIRWLKEQRGTWPRIMSAPPEFKGALGWFTFGASFLLFALLAAHIFGGPGWAAAVAFVWVTVGLYMYEKAYERAAVQVRQRLEQLR